MMSEAVNEVTVVQKKQRSSNLELYRIVCMLMIIAHHYVASSGLLSPAGPLYTNHDSAKSLYLLVFGVWGKVGINCFLMITGYFMCTSQITVRKFLKLLLQVYFYKTVIYFIFLYFGYETITPLNVAKLFLPLWTLSNRFAGSFLIFYLTIPFWNILIRNITKRQHLLLLLLLLSCYTLLGSIPTFKVRFNYVTWFGLMYLIASYIRLYPRKSFTNKSLWGWLSIISIIAAMASVVIMHIAFSKWIFFLGDCNKIFAVVVAVCTFLWFKNLKLEYSKAINTIAAGTFGVLLIHANSDAMRAWLWRDVVDCIGHYSLPMGSMVLYSLGVVLLVFVICNLIDQLRIATFEKYFFRYYDNHLSSKVDRLVNKLVEAKV